MTASFLALLAAVTPPLLPAHQVWADGAIVPDWVRNACCGPSDAHHLRPPQVRRVPGGYAVDGVRGLVP